MIRLAIAQIDTVLGDVEANLETHMARIDEAVQAKADLVVFPELSLTGYALQDLTAAVARRPMADDPVFQTLLTASQRTDLLVGFVEHDKRHRIYNSAAYLSQGEILSVHRKVYLPTYGLFDESRFFAWGDSIRAFNTRFGRLGVLICEDFWHASPPYLLWLDGADLLLFMSASPGRTKRLVAGEQRLIEASGVGHRSRAGAAGPRLRQGIRQPIGQPDDEVGGLDGLVGVDHGEARGLIDERKQQIPGRAVGPEPIEPLRDRRAAQLVQQFGAFGNRSAHSSSRSGRTTGPPGSSRQRS